MSHVQDDKADVYDVLTTARNERVIRNAAAGAAVNVETAFPKELVTQPHVPQHTHATCSIHAACNHQLTRVRKAHPMSHI